jgi:Fe-S oxidoreductase
MTPMPGGALQQFLGRQAERILGACTQCGKCFEACPMTPYSAPLNNADPGSVTAGILGLLRGEPGSAEALGWASVCVRTGACVPACPENVNPRMMLAIARIGASGGLGGTQQIAVRRDRDFFDRVRAFGQLQLAEDELREWT